MEYMGIMMLKHQLWGGQEYSDNITTRIGNVTNACHQRPPNPKLSKTSPSGHHHLPGWSVKICKVQTTPTISTIPSVQSFESLKVWPSLQSFKVWRIWNILKVCIYMYLQSSDLFSACSVVPFHVSHHVPSANYLACHSGGLSDYVRRHGFVSFKMCPPTVLCVLSPSTFKNLVMMGKSL